MRETKVAKLLNRHRIRRIDAAPGTVEAACAHIGVQRERLRLVDRQIGAAEKRIDAILARDPLKIVRDRLQPRLQLQSGSLQRRLTVIAQGAAPRGAAAAAPHHLRSFCSTASSFCGVTGL